MLRTSVLAKHFLRRNGVNENCYGIFSHKLKQRIQLNNIHSCCRRQTLSLGSPKNLLAVKRNRKESSFKRYESAQATAARNENFVLAKSHFQEILNRRKVEAHQSVLVEVANKEDVPFAMAYCEKFGTIANIYSYSNESTNNFLLCEFSSEASAKKLLQNCGFKKIEDAFPVCSRLIKYVKKPDAQLPEGNLNLNEESSLASSFRPGASLSEVIQDIYESETLTETDIRLRFLLCSLIKDSISGLFPHCDVLPFGSSVNGIGRRGCDLDIVIRLYPEKVNGDGEAFFLNKTSVGNNKNLQLKTLLHLEKYILLSPGMARIDLIARARVPILKMSHKILKLDFDLSVNNMSAVFMSDILHFCGEIDPRVRPLMHIVKKWAKDANITQDYPGSQISNFGLVNLVLFFLQTRKPHPILPPLSEVFVITGSDNSYDYQLQYLKPIEEWKAFASQNEESLAVLLKEFLLFMATYDFQGSILSLMGGESRTRTIQTRYEKSSNMNDNSEPLWIQYLMEEGMNATKNISKSEYDSLREKARTSANILGENLMQKVNTLEDFSAMLGIPSANRIDSNPERFDVKSTSSNKGNAQNRNKNIIRNR